ncbi:coniferyl-alcohol dehydrogenase [Gordonia sp. (in: high G+C Gram-positive bacteria)]|uniref:coniferyl-alcohol dehydrogenase n=1 Tax=Gordonia sp. (in: high G+C Gram-positive bacteria) TaxID=84139 RepID=UPI003F9B645D
MTANAPVVVTGAASGIGAALTDQLRAAGREVIGLDRTEGPGIVECDLSDPASIDAALPQIPAVIAGLANVAGVPGTAPSETVLRVNVLGPRILTQSLLPRLPAGSAIVNVASVAAHRNTAPQEAVEELIVAAAAADIRTWLDAHPADGPAAYDTSKRVVVDWTARLAGALIDRGIRALSVSPGPVQTPILDDFTVSMGKESMDRSVATVGRYGRPGEIASVVAFALSAQASWLNGIDIPVEGGLLCAREASKHPAVDLVGASDRPQFKGSTSS